MSKITFKPFTLSGHSFKIELSIHDNTLTEKNYNLISISPFNYGFNETKDTIFYPENVSIEFSIVNCLVPFVGYPNPFDYFENSDEDYKQEYFNLINSFTFFQSLVTIWRDGKIFLQGTIDRNSITSDYSLYKFQLTILSNFFMLKDVDPRIDTLGLPQNTDTKMLFKDMILHIVKSVLPHVNKINIYTEVSFIANYSFMGNQVKASFDMTGAYLFDYIGNEWCHPDYITLLKDILATFGLIMFIYDDTIVLKPRWYFPSNPFVLQDSMVISGPDAISSNAIGLKGLSLRLIHSGYTFKQSYNLGIVEYDSNGNILNNEEVELLYLSQPAGVPPGMPDTTMNQRNLWVYIPEYIAGLGNAQWVGSTPNSAHLSSNPDVKTNLWKLIGDRLWQLISKERLAFKVELYGTDYLLNPFFTHPSFPGKVFRIRTASIEFTKQTSSLELLSC